MSNVAALRTEWEEAAEVPHAGSATWRCLTSYLVGQGSSL